MTRNLAALGLSALMGLAYLLLLALCAGIVYVANL